MHLAPFHWEQAQLLERVGRRADAAHHYERFLSLWNGADPELQPQLEAARRRLAQLRADGV